MSEIIDETAPEVRVVREPLTYERHMNDRSYFQDIVLAQARGDEAARYRLARHTLEMRVEVPKLERRAPGDVAMERRLNPNRLVGDGGNFAPPLWMNELFATAPRPGRVLSSLIPRFTLPLGISSVNLPVLTTGTTAPLSGDLAAVPTRDIVDAQAQSPSVPFAGQGDVSLQLLEQSPGGAHLDWVLFKDLTASYDHQLELMLINGTGAGGQFTGMLNLEGISKVTYTQASPTGSLTYPFLGQAAAQLGDARLLPPECWMMRTARWAWLGTAEDTAGQPLNVPSHNPSPMLPHQMDDDAPTPVSQGLGWPIYANDAIPATLGAGSNQDAIIVCRPTDSILLEASPRTVVDLDVLSGTLDVRLQLRAYAAAVHRYPSGIATVTGTGMVVQSGY